MSTIVNKIESILTSEYSTANFVELMREIFDSMKIVAPNNFRQEFSNFSTHIVGRLMLAIIQHLKTKRLLYLQFN